MKNLLLLLPFFALIFIVGCSDDDDTGNLTLTFTGLEDLESDAIYEGWIMVNGTPKTTGTFTVDANGDLSKTKFDVSQEDLDIATAFILTIEQVPDPSAAPSDVHILAGDFSAASAALTVGHSAAIGDSYASASGSYILATPTNGAGSDENSGVWWLDPTSGPSASLTLPTLPAGWKYEGWAVIGGTPVTTGTFTTVAGADDAAPYSGMMPAPPFPGEDFLNNAPNNLTFPTNLAGTTVVVSIEPDPDNSASPFTLKPLVADVSTSATSGVNYDMTNNAAGFPTGTATR